MKILGKTKIFLIAGIIAVLFGMVLLGIFGLNKTVDYKESYEIKVSVNQNVQNSSEVIKDAAEKYFSEKGLKYVAYGTQSIEEGQAFIYKTNNKKDISAAELKTALQTALDDKAEATGLVADALVYKTSVTPYYNVFNVVIATVIAVAVAFILGFFTVKTAGATAVACSAVISALLFVSLVSLLRVPAEPFFAAGLAIAVILAETFSFAGVHALRKGLKASDKADLGTVKDGVLGKLLKLIAAITIAAAVFTVVALIFGKAYLVFGGLQLLIAVIVSGLTSLIGSPVVFDALRKKQ